MGRTTPPKGVHTSPDNAGIKNMPEVSVDEDRKAEMMVLKVPLEKGMENKKYAGLWTEETLKQQLADYCTYVMESGLKPSKSSVRLWLGISKPQYWEWENFPEKYGYKSNLLAQMADFMETSYVQRMEKYPTGNIFLLKTSHGHVETSKVDITANQTANTSEDVKDLVSKLGLNSAE